MRWDKYIDADEVRKAIAVLQEPGGVFEVRVIGTAKKDIMSGYFRDAEALLEEFVNIDLRRKDVYVALGKIKEECFARAQSEHFLKSPQTSSDTEVVSYRWFFVDIDPVRSAGISSSQEEIYAAEVLVDKVLTYLNSLGFSEPVLAESGNGYHLLYRIDIPNNSQNVTLIEKCLKVLSGLFDTDEVKVDTTNYNPSRICKLHGTLAQKGTSTKSRPHRMSRIIIVPAEVKITPIESLQALTAELPDKPVPAKRRVSHPQQEFDLLDFMSRNGMTYKEDANDRAKIFKLDECPFDHNHKDGDAKIFLYPDGAIAFKCHHNSCRRYKWQDVRLKFEPDAYDKKEDDAKYDIGYQKQRQVKKQEQKQKKEEPVPKQEKKKPLRKLKTAEALMAKDLPEPRVFIGVDDELPFLLEGTCILSAKPKLGKSWLALAMCLAVSNGDRFLGYKTHKCSTLYLDLETSETLQKKRLLKILKGDKVPKNFYLDTETDNLDNGFIAQIEAYLKEDPDIGVVVIDVFQIIRSQSTSYKETEYEHAYRDITPLNELAQKHHIAIILVCHDRKAVDPDDPFSNILGSTGLQGAATQMIVMFRKGKDSPIHISIKGKTIDGLPELNVKLDNAVWSIVDGDLSGEQEKARRMEEYKNSDIRKAVVEIAEKLDGWQGRCSAIIEKGIDFGIGISESPKEIGIFMHKHQGSFLKVDNVKVTIIKNGTGPKIYRVEKFTIDTIDENQEVTIDGWRKPTDTAVIENIFP